jgi:hypothetical protein
VTRPPVAEGADRVHRRQVIHGGERVGVIRTESSLKAFRGRLGHREGLATHLAAMT